MNIPNQLKIGAANVEVRVQDSVKASGGEEVLGISKCSIGRIEIANSYMGEPCREDVLVDTFLHEILHIVSANFGIGLSERQASGVAGALLMVIRDNDLDFRKGE